VPPHDAGPLVRFRTRTVLLACLIVAAGVVWLRPVDLPPAGAAFSQSGNDVEAYDFVELTARISAPRAHNPFTGASVRATFSTRDGHEHWQIDGFCDADDGSVFRVRFMPRSAGDYTYSVEYRQGWWKKTASGAFRVIPGRRRGPIRVDPQHRWHFIWEGTGEHYFFNGTTAYWLMGWTDDRVIEAAIDRLHRLKINRIRVTVAGRTGTYYGEPVMTGPNWTSFLTPWPGAAAARILHVVGRLGQRAGPASGASTFEALSNLTDVDDIYHPGFDYTRYRVAYWQKFERALRYARDRDVVFSLVLDMNDSRAHPAAGSADEYRFIRYAVARFGAFSNITWDLGDDLDRYRDDRWTHETGTLIKQWDPYRHLATSHPVDNVHQDRTSDWFDFTSFQEWSRAQHAFMTAQRRTQQKLGRIIPQTNEEYGYEDHYPMWAAGPGSESADVLRRTAWEIVMAGGYQTAGETVRRGTNIWPDTGGGWINGRGDGTMTMLEGYGHMVDFFTSFDWWRAEPRDDLVGPGSYCLAVPGEFYAIYLPQQSAVAAQLEPGEYEAVWWNAASGEKTGLPAVTITTARSWSSPRAPGAGDWALLIRRK